MKMTLLQMKLAGIVMAVAAAVSPSAYGQLEGSVATQILVRAEGKSEAAPTVASTTLELNNKVVALKSLEALPANGIQVALLIDDGLQRSSGVELSDIKEFVNGLPAGSEVLVGYLENGRVVETSPFTTDHAAAAKSVRTVFGVAGQSGSPYLCLSDFVKKWPAATASVPAEQVGYKAQDVAGKGRFVIMLTNGADPYNGSTSITNQDSPYVQAAALDAQRAGVAVYSIYYGDAGFGGSGGSASFSGQSYLKQVADATGGVAYYEGVGNPVSFSPYFKRFQSALAESYVASFDAIAHGRNDLMRVKLNTTVPKLKLRHPDAVRAGNVE